MLKNYEMYMVGKVALSNTIGYVSQLDPHKKAIKTQKEQEEL